MTKKEFIVQTVLAMITSGKYTTFSYQNLVTEAERLANILHAYNHLPDE